MTFCSRASLGAHEPMAGTGVRADAYVFLPVDKRLWRESEMNSAWASPEELAAIRAARSAGVVTRLYDPPDGADGGAVLVYARPGAAPEGLAALLSVVSRRWPVDDRQTPRLAICTHGTRDRCCAKWGFAAYKAARALYAQGESPFEPIECSHLGGDRFAATGLFLPSGAMYAHLDWIDLGALAALDAAGRIAPQTYRGGVYEPQLAQVVRAGLAQCGLFNDLRTPLQIRRLSPTELEVAAGASRFHVVVDTVEVRFYGSCAKADADKPSAGRRTVFVRAERVAAPAA